MIFPEQVRNLVTNCLNEFDPQLAKQNAIELLLLTTSVESGCGYYLSQIKGPARGIFQMEPNTEHDIWVNYLKFHPDYEEKIKMVAVIDSSLTIRPLEYNLYYQIIMCRLHYRRIKTVIPDSNNIQALAQYWKQYYNTPLGKGTVEVAVDAYNKFFKK